MKQDLYVNCGSFYNMALWENLLLKTECGYYSNMVTFLYMTIIKIHLFAVLAYKAMLHSIHTGQQQCMTTALYIQCIVIQYVAKNKQKMQYTYKQIN